MNRIADNIRKYNGENPFNDSQPRNFSDDKVTNEFYPTSIFWSLFNDQHEVLIGTRGSGKTFLLKMMRYSMLKRLSDQRARKIVEEKNFIALYVPMNLEFVGSFSNQSIPEKSQIPFFQFAFNCLLAESLITEIISLLDEEQDELERAIKNRHLAKQLSLIWFNCQPQNIFDISSLVTSVRSLFYNCDIKKGLKDVPTVFTKPIGSSLQSIKEVVRQTFSFKKDPTWIICIDEAEFLKLPFQRCINTLFRSDSKRLVLKVATLPFHHETRETLVDNVYAVPGNDFNYKVIDMKYDSEDFIQVTNSLCEKRIKERFLSNVPLKRLEDFVGVIGNDDLIDYYRQEVGDKDAQKNIIEKKIISEFSDKRRHNAEEKIKSTNSLRKTVYDKFAPIFFVREMYKLSKNGHTIPGWYAGSAMIRKISQGNPRRFIQLMNDLFEKARTSLLNPKTQHDVIFKFASINSDATQALEKYGPEVKEKLDQVAEWLKARAHNGPLIYSGNTFKLDITEKEIENNKKWIELAVAYLRLIVDEVSLLNGISINTKYSLANIYSAKYWIPMRDGGFPKYKLSSKEKYLYQINHSIFSQQETEQISLFESEEEN